MPPTPGRIFAGDEELGKKYDDHRPNGSAKVPSWSTWQNSTPRIRRHRLFLVLLACVALYLFVKYIPTDLGTVDERLGRPLSRGTLGQHHELLEDSEKPSKGSDSVIARYPPVDLASRPEGKEETDKHFYNGQIKFYYLAASLHGIARTMGYKDVNKNVLFAAGNLQSAARLIPLACEMARWNRNFVHFAIMGRDDLPLDAIKEVNGVDPECDMFWHDARPDYSTWSTHGRMEFSVTAGLGHIERFMHPQVILIDDSAMEESYFTKGMRSSALASSKCIIELPTNAAEDLLWVTRLDTGSLSAWHTTYIDIVIHAPPDSSGSLIRLLKSIESADYFGSRRPHLTIELPTDIDLPTKKYIDNMVWPPLDWSSGPHASQITLRRRISRSRLAPEEASAAFVESFYPARSKQSHVLVVSPQVELSPMYYHYLLYNLLEYKYSSYASESPETRNLMGLSLELPSNNLDEKTALVPPKLPKSSLPDGLNLPANEPIPFMWQAPNSNAALYFGEKWTELHSFITSRISAQKSHAPLDQRPLPRRKEINEKYPAWTEYLLELMRLRSYSLLYPHFPQQTIVTIHNELYTPPPEFTFPPVDPSEPDSPPDIDPNEPFIATPPSNLKPSTSSSTKQISKHDASKTHQTTLLTKPLLSLLPFSGDLPELSNLPLLKYTGRPTTASEAQSAAESFADIFRVEIGGCSSRPVTNAKPKVPGSADDLFCLNDPDLTIPSTRKSPRINPSNDPDNPFGDDNDDDDDDTDDYFIHADANSPQSPPPPSPPPIKPKTPTDPEAQKRAADEKLRKRLEKEERKRKNELWEFGGHLERQSMKRSQRKG